MKQYFLSFDMRSPAGWHDAFPDGLVLSGAGGAAVEGGVAWLRLARGADLGKLLVRARQLVDGPVVVMSDVPAEEETAAVLAAGAAGYCNTHAAPEVLQQVASVVAQGGLWVGAEIMQRLMLGTARVLAARQSAANGDWRRELTEREQDVAQRVALGASNREIAEALQITERTVKAHLGTIFDKLLVRDRLQLSLLVNGLWP
jgi:DNA-binding NarL/FixJ family response regulator